MNKLKICYICGPLGTYNSEFKLGAYDDASMYDLRYRACELFLQNQDHCDLHLKLGYNVENMGGGLELFVAEKIPNSRVIPSSTKLTDVYREMDAFILEIPSTTLFEVEKANTPILVLSDITGVKLRVNALKSLEKRATVCKGRQEFLKEIENLVKKGRDSNVFTENKISSEFYEMFMTSKKGRGLDLAVEFLNELVERK